MRTATLLLFLWTLKGVSALQVQISHCLNLSAEAPADRQMSQAANFGRSLFTGRAPLHGRMYLHFSDLPPEVVRCGNCHAVANGPSIKRSTAPRLTPELLLVPASRRGGPPSTYNSSTFCALLRKGTDPAYVVVDVDMPRYSVSDTECAALWNFLTEPFPHDRHDTLDTH